MVSVIEHRSDTSKASKSSSVPLVVFVVHLDISDRLTPIHIRNSMLSFDAIAQGLRQDSFPEEPVYRTCEEHGDSNNWEDEIWISVRITRSIRRNKWHNS